MPLGLKIKRASTTEDGGVIFNDLNLETIILNATDLNFLVEMAGTKGKQCEVCEGSGEYLSYEDLPHFQGLPHSVVCVRCHGSGIEKMKPEELSGLGALFG
jgi:hypothetical protein